MEPIPDYGEHMTLEEFSKAVRSGSYNGYDGNGYYATSSEMTDEQIDLPNIDQTYTHVVWFNK
jgi:hypothetical protein